MACKSIFSTNIMGGGKIQIISSKSYIFLSIFSQTQLLSDGASIDIMPLQIDVVTDVFAFQTNKIEAAVIYFPVCELPLPQILEECRMRHLHSDSRRCNEAGSDRPSHPRPATTNRAYSRQMVLRNLILHMKPHRCLHIPVQEHSIDSLHQ